MTLFTEQDVMKWERPFSLEMMGAIFYVGEEQLVKDEIGEVEVRKDDDGTHLTSPYRINFEGELRRVYVTIRGNGAAIWFGVGLNRRIFIINQRAFGQMAKTATMGG